MLFTQTPALSPALNREGRVPGLGRESSQAIAVLGRPWWAHRLKHWGFGVACSPESRGLCPCPQLFAVGGFDGLRRLRSVERYDPFSNTWVDTAPLPEAVSSAAVAPCAGQLYVIGGAGQDGVNTNKVGSGFVVGGQ